MQTISIVRAAERAIVVQTMAADMAMDTGDRTGAERHMAVVSAAHMMRIRPNIREARNIYIRRLRAAGVATTPDHDPGLVECRRCGAGTPPDGVYSIDGMAYCQQCWTKATSASFRG